MLSFSVFERQQPRQGDISEVLNGAPFLSVALAASTDSVAITGPSILVLTADEAMRVTLVKGAAPGVDPGASAMKLVADTPTRFELTAGNWYLRWVAATPASNPAAIGYADAVALNNNVITQLPASPVASGVTVQADSANSVTIRVGKATASATVGFPLAAGQTLSGIEVSDLSAIYAFAAVAGQKLNVLAI